jgi:hypothetical protein
MSPLSSFDSKKGETIEEVELISENPNACQIKLREIKKNPRS